MAHLTFELDSSEIGVEPITIRRTDGGILITGTDLHLEVDDDETPGDSAITEIWNRWQKENAGTGAFELVDTLRARGLGVVAPNIRKEGKAVEPYLRLLTKSHSGVTIAAYINTNAMIVSRAKLRPVAAVCAGADVHANGDVYFDVDDVQGCLAVVDKLLEL